ncbi:MAG TPA: ABC transporter permease [Myxococcaceae bacterium]|nr:ABC transporter permease [Myxococcaceae bacterium]
MSQLPASSSPSPLAGIGKDVRVAVRHLLRERGFTATAVLTLALATGATTAVFTLVNAVLLRPLAYRAPEQLVRIYDVQPDVPRASVSVPDAHDWITRSRSLSGLALFSQGSKSLTGDGEPIRVSTQRMNAGALRVLGLPPLLGREFTEDEDRFGGPAVAMLGERFWRKQFAGRPDIVGTTVRLDGRDHLVLGVVREQPHWFADSDIWVPLQNDPAKTPRGTHFMNAIGRLAPGVTVAAAQKDLASVVKAIALEAPDYQHHGILVLPWVDELLGEARASLGALGAVVGLVLLIACVNLANLLLARGAARRREVAVRMALGADRWRVARALLVEAAVLSVLGTGLGLLVGWAGSLVLRGALPVRAPALASAVALDGRVLAFSVGLCVLTTVLFGVLPSLLLARGDLGAVRGEMRTALGHRTQWLQSALVVFEVALALAPLLGAALVLQSVQRLLQQDPGFRTENAVAFRIQLPVERYPDDASRRAMVEAYLPRLRALPGVSHAGAVNDLPLSGSNTNGNFSIEGQVFDKAREPAIEYRLASPGYLEAMGIPLREGRTFEEGDRAGGERVALVNAEAVRRFWGGRSPLGARIRPGDGEGEGEEKEPWRRIVGVVGDVHHSSLGEKPRPEMYYPLDQDTSNRVSFVLRTREAVAPLASAARRELAAVDPGLSLYDVKTLEDRVSGSVAAPRAAGLLLGLFAGLAVVLAAAGVYGVLAFSVAQRTREIGIRMAIGASARSVRWWVLRRALGLGGIGILAGLGGAFLLGRSLERLLYGVAPSDPPTALAAAAMLSAVTVAAALLPANRATRVDPQEALRAE